MAKCPCCGGSMTLPVPREQLAGLSSYVSPVFYKMVQRLAWRPGALVSYRELIDHIWGNDINGGPIDPKCQLQQQKLKSQIALSELGWKIESQFGIGMRLVPIAGVEQ